MEVISLGASRVDNAGPAASVPLVAFPKVLRLVTDSQRANLPAMLHIALHFAVPIAVALGCYRRRWRRVALILIGTMVVDLDHLLADPIYDPERCSIGFHPLHEPLAIVLYGMLVVFPLPVIRKSTAQTLPLWSTVHLVGLGLLIHMFLDWTDCLS